jgi:NAD-dependent DNA ligase
MTVGVAGARRVGPRGSKFDNAKALNVPVLSESQFEKLIGAA